MQSEFKKPSGYVQTGTWPQLAGTELAEDGQTPSDSYKVGLQFRHLYLLVAFWPNERSLLTRVRDIHIRLFPGSECPDPDYTIQLAHKDGPIDRLMAFANGLAVWHGANGGLTKQ